MSVVILSTTFVWNIPRSEKNSARCYHNCTLVFVWSTRYSCHILVNLNIFPQIFANSTNLNFFKNSSSGNRVGPYGLTDGHRDRHNEANSRFPQFCERAWKSVGLIAFKPRDFFTVRYQPQHLSWERTRKFHHPKFILLVALTCRFPARCILWDR